MAEAVSRAIAEQGTADNAVTGECHVNLVIPPPHLGKMRILDMT